MKRTTRALVAHLFVGDITFSRNRNFAAFDDPRFREAISVTRRLRGLLLDLEKLASSSGALVVASIQHAGRPAVRLELSAKHGKRVSYLRDDEWEVFCAHARAGALVDALQAAA